MAAVRVYIGNMVGSLVGFQSLSRVPAAAPFERMFNQWASSYAKFTRRRYDTNSGGGGDWQPLALSTIKARAKPKRKNKAFTSERGGNSRRSFLARDTRRGALVASPRSYNILKDEGTLFASLTLNSESFKRIPNGATYSIGGSGERRDIARYHQDGTSRMPPRPILVYPDATTLMSIRREAVSAVRQMIREAK